MTYKLSILIATIPSRQKSFHRLVEGLGNTQGVEISLDGSTDLNIGQKRNDLLLCAKGDYVVFIDDDDEVSENYIDLILKATELNPDCIGINGIMTTNGKDERKWFISKEYKTWHERDRIYFRTPNHISPVKRELALQAGFPPISHGEDFAYSMALLPLLRTETLISHPLYHYRYISNKK